MNFWKRYPADYKRKTARLTLAQHGAYTLLLDELYTSEQALPADLLELNRICSAMDKGERDAVRLVAERFFPIGPDGNRHNKRAGEELEEAAPAVAAARANGAKGGRPKKPRTEPSGNPAGSEKETQKEPSSKAPHSSESSSSEELPPSGVQGAKRSRRCPAGFNPEPQIWAAIQAECPGVSLARETERFKDWEFQKPRSDWVAAWRIWMRRAFDELPRRAPAQSFRERDAAAVADRVREMTGGLLDMSRADSNTIEMEAPCVAQIGNH